MDIDEVKKILSTWAANKPLISRVSIFGSRARGNYRANSDIDIAVELDLSAVQGEDDSGGLATWMHETVDWEDELQAQLPFKIDLEQYRGDATPTIKEGLQRSSVIAYEKDSTIENT